MRNSDFLMEDSRISVQLPRRWGPGLSLTSTIWLGCTRISPPTGIFSRDLGAHGRATRLGGIRS